LAKWLPDKWAHHVVFPIEGTFGLALIAASNEVVLNMHFHVWCKFKFLKLFVGGIGSGIWLQSISCMDLWMRRLMYLHLEYCYLSS
jgi:hypothetical protein